MPLKSGLAVYFYNLSQPQLGNTDYAEFLSGLTFTTVSPGGFGDLHCRIALKDARLPLPQLALFSRIAVMDGLTPVWLGEISEAALGLGPSSGEYIEIAALGLGNCLRDDPRDDSYNANTAKSIISAQLSTGNRPNFFIVDQDTALIFPDNPGATYSPAYPGKNMEEVVNDVVTLASGGGQEYSWGMWAHAKNKDAALFPTGQLVIHLKDTATIGFQAYQDGGDVLGWSVSPSGERAFNVVAIKYNDPAQSPPVGYVTYTDPRLAANGSQGTAPFRRRKYAQDFSGISTVTKGQAQNIANTFGATYQNITNKVEIVLAGLRDANGSPINLWLAQADRNIYVPSLAVRGATQLALAATAGTNLFYIVQTTYAEDDQGATLTLECDNFVDTGEKQLARLQLRADEQQRAGGTTSGVVQSLGAPLKGGVALGVNAGANAQTWSKDISYGCALSQAPTSITLSALSSANITSVNVTSLGIYDSIFNMVVTNAGLGTWSGTWLTNGNCVLDVDLARETFDHHCDVCEREGRVAIRRGLRLRRHLRIHTDVHPDPALRGEPGYTALCFDCPGCGTTTECFNSNLGPEDEDAEREGNHPWRAQQARHIRAIMRFHGLKTREEPLPLPPEPTSAIPPVALAPRKRTRRKREQTA